MADQPTKSPAATDPDDIFNDAKRKEALAKQEQERIAQESKKPESFADILGPDAKGKAAQKAQEELRRDPGSAYMQQVGRARARVMPPGSSGK